MANSTTQVIGTVAVVPMGAWNATTTYQKLNAVRLNNTTYMATQQNQNIQPGITAGWDTVWMTIAADGVDALLPQEIMTTTTVPVVQSTLTTSAEQFNRVPIQGETFIQQYAGVGTLLGRSWITNNTVQTVATTITVLITQVFETTGATGPQGEQGITGKSLTDKGLWSATATYVNNTQEQDFVTYNGSTYRVANTQTSVTGVVPTNTTYWTLMASQGVAGDGAGNLYATNPTGLTAGTQYVLVPSTPLPDGTSGAVSVEMQEINYLSPFDVDCDHEYEITGYTGDETNAEIPETCQVTVSKIQGQTATVSPNLLNIADVAGTTTNGITYSITNGVITLNGTATAYLEIYLVSNVNYVIGNYSIAANNNFSANENTVIFFDSAVGNVAKITLNNSNSFVSFNATNPITIIKLAVSANATFSNATFSPMLVKGTYTADTMPPFQPFNNNLTNSKVECVLSTGKNLLDLPATYSATKGGVTLSLNNGLFTLIGTATGGAYFEIPLNTLINANYPIPLTLSRSQSWQGNMALDGNASNSLIAIGWNATSATINNQLTDNITKLVLDVASGQTVNLTFNVMLNYGSTAEEYTPYISDTTFAINKEISQFGSIDNTTGQYVEYGVLPASSLPTTNWSETFTLALPANATNAVFNDAHFSVQNGVIQATGFDSVSAITDYITANNVQYLYNSTTPTAQGTIDLPAGYSVWLGGLQQQVIDGDYLPYIISKVYPISIADQTKRNVIVDRQQQVLIDNNTADIQALQTQMADAAMLGTAIASFNGSGTGTITSGTLPDNTLYVICVPNADTTTPPFVARASGTTLYTSSNYNGTNVALYAVSQAS